MNLPVLIVFFVSVMHHLSDIVTIVLLVILNRMTRLHDLSLSPILAWHDINGLAPLSAVSTRPTHLDTATLNTPIVQVHVLLLKT